MSRRKKNLINRNRLSLLILAAAVCFLLYPLMTNFYAWYEQENLKEQIMNSNQQPDDDLSSGTAVSEFNGALLEIPVLGLSVPVQEGTAQDQLAIAPGRYTESALPGQGNTAIAGHRTMYGGPFRHLAELEPGDMITLTCDDVIYKYEVEKLYIVENNDWSVIEPCGYPALTLTTCSQEGRAVRQVARARLVSDDSSINNHNSKYTAGE